MMPSTFFQTHAFFTKTTMVRVADGFISVKQTQYAVPHGLVTYGFEVIPTSTPVYVSDEPTTGDFRLASADERAEAEKVIRNELSATPTADREFEAAWGC